MTPRLNNLTIPSLLIGMLLYAGTARSQEKSPVTFGKASVADFDLSKYKFDSGASAVVIADIGSTSFEGNNKGYFSMLFTRHSRIKILNKNGFDAASGSILLIGSGGDRERLSNFRASSFNIENGAVVETKLEEKALFSEKVSKESEYKKYTMPAVKAGTIFDISYTITSEFFVHLQSWKFQGDYPCLWSEYSVAIPSFFNYVATTQGDVNFAINDASTKKTEYTIHESEGTGALETYRVSGTAINHRWVKKNVPVLKYENYTTSIRNHLSRVSFQLHYTQFGDGAERHNYMTDWYEASDKLLKREDFGIALDYDNRWMKEPLAGITAGATTELEKAGRIYRFVRDHFTCTDHDMLWVETPLKDVFKNKSGNVAEINLLLTAMLRHESIHADPVILSTRDNGYADPTYPLISEYNYVLCQVMLSDKTYNLDASCRSNGFGFIPGYCYNGEARVVSKTAPYTLGLFSDSLREFELSSVFISNDSGGVCSGSYERLLSAHASYDLRNKIKETSSKEYYKTVQQRFGSDFPLEKMAIDSLDSLEKPLRLRCEFTLKNLTGSNVIYFNPMFGEGYQTNPFQSENRQYPVEMPATINSTFVLNMQIPEGFSIEELPKSARINYNDNDGIFEYLIGRVGDGVQLRVVMKFNKTVIPVEDYASIRDFFASVVKKESEQIVFKKGK